MPDGIITQVVELADKDGEAFSLVPSENRKYHEVLALQSEHFCVLDILNDRGDHVGVVNYYFDPAETATVYLNWVALSLFARDRGYLTALLDFAVAYFPEAGVKKLVLDVLNVARETFESFGFEEDPSVESQYGRIRMIRQFD